MTLDLLSLDETAVTWFGEAFLFESKGWCGGCHTAKSGLDPLAPESRHSWLPARSGSGTGPVMTMVVMMTRLMLMLDVDDDDRDDHDDDDDDDDDVVVCLTQGGLLDGPIATHVT